MNSLIIAGLCLAPILLYLLHRLLLWMEQKGWIYYWHKSGSGGIGNAIMPIQAIFQPEIRYTLEEQTRQHVENEDAGDPLR
ncbi:MAG: hypothetical protein SGI88_09450 [Candidatus Hydrogenedentes bacterium]|nr:hypothetical protein [Candidatus Hydrogenedentota bacterium]